MAYEAAYETMVAAVARRDRLDNAIAGMAADSRFTPVVDRLGCLRGISTLTAFGLAVEIGDWQRLTGPTIGAYLGMTPTEHSSGQSRSQGGVTKTGNGHARRLLIEAAWHHRSPVPARARSAQALGEGAPGGPSTRSCRQPSACTPAGRISMRPQETPGGRQRRHRPRTGRLVLVTGHPRRPNTPRKCPAEQLGGDGKRLGVTRGRPMSNHVASGQADDARPLDPRHTPARKPVLR